MRLATVLAALAAAAPLPAQSLLYRPPNLSGTWVPDAGVLQFNFLHRFHVSPGPGHSVANYPTFTFAFGLPARLGIGIRYATHSDAATLSRSNETELYAKWHREFGAVSLAVTPAYNLASKSVDGELGVDWSKGPLTLLGAVRAMSHAYKVDTSRIAVAGGAVIRINQYIGLSGDVASLLSRRAGEQIAWSAGLVFAIPNSPHTFSLHVSNVDVNSIEGSSKKGYFSSFQSKPLYGFEFTVPVHPSRFRAWFRKSPATAVTGDVGAAVAATVAISAMKFRGDTVEIAAGQAVQWNNSDPLAHTITFDPATGESSSELIPPNGSYVHRFAKAGVYAYSCTPHPFMKGVVVVK